MHVGRVYSRKRWFPMEALNKLIPPSDYPPHRRQMTAIIGSPPLA